MNTSKIHPLPKETFESLMNIRAHHCVSIYIPMDTQGKEQNLHLAQARLKQCINKAKKLLGQQQMQKDKITEHLEPLEQLLQNIQLWRNPSQGLAIFLDSDQGMRYYLVPITFETFTYVADHYYLKPLLPLYHDDGSYYVLELSRDFVRLFEASRYGFKDLNIEDFAPNKLEEAVGFDYKPKMFQFRSGQNVHSAGSFHGHGEGKDDSKKELVTFFRAVDEGLKKSVPNTSAPLVLACVDYLFNLFKDTSSYNNIYEKNIGGDPEFLEVSSLHQKSWDLIESYFKKTRQRKIARFTEVYHTDKTSSQINEILNAALMGKVDTLFVEKGTDRFGVYDRANNKIVFDDIQTAENASLINLTAIETFKQGGQVYFLPYEEMPIKGNIMNALFRY